MLRRLAPYDTGNLALNAIKIEFPDPNTCVISVDESIAPYMPYTTFPWLAARWNGKKNPNEGWWEDANKKCMEALAKRIQGVLR